MKNDETRKALEEARQRLYRVKMECTNTDLVFGINPIIDGLDAALAADKPSVGLEPVQPKADGKFEAWKDIEEHENKLWSVEYGGGVWLKYPNDPRDIWSFWPALTRRGHIKITGEELERCRLSWEGRDKSKGPQEGTTKETAEKTQTQPSPEAAELLSDLDNLKKFYCIVSTDSGPWGKFQAKLARFVPKPEKVSLPTRTREEIELEFGRYALMGSANTDARDEKYLDSLRREWTEVVKQFPPTMRDLISEGMEDAIAQDISQINAANAAKEKGK